MDEDRRWFHVIISTYGSWLYGDPRGYRTRHHREHVDGDYKSPPPPGLYERRFKKSQQSLKEKPVVIPVELRSVIRDAIIERFSELDCVLLALAVAGQHCHYQIKQPPRLVRTWAGCAKRHSWYVVDELGWKTHLWAKRGKAVPIKERSHQENVYWYILNHRHEGAAVWTALKCHQYLCT